MKEALVFKDERLKNFNENLELIVKLNLYINNQLKNHNGCIIWRSKGIKFNKWVCR